MSGSLVPTGIPAGVAAGHQATAEAGLRMLAAGGTAGDAGAAALLACCVAETISTGIGGGGFATYFDAANGKVTCLDFFCAVPGLDGTRAAQPMVRIDVMFGAVPLDYKIGGASVAVPGVPAGAAEIHRRWGRLPWSSVVEPAAELAEVGVSLPEIHARTLVAVAAALTCGEGAEVYAPGGKLLGAGDTLYHPGLAATLRSVAERGADIFYRGPMAAAIVDSVRAAGGNVGAADLGAYRVRQVRVRRASLGDALVAGRDDLNATLRSLTRLPSELDRLGPAQRAMAVTHALLGRRGDGAGETTNISVVDPAGNACVITSSLGIGAGVWPPGLGIHLNSMLGEGELIANTRAAGQRIGSMMCPLVALDQDGRLMLGAGSAGASRIRSALTSTLIHALVDGWSTAQAVAAPRIHPVASSPDAAVVHAEPGYPEEGLHALADAGYAINRWPDLDVYFGGVSAIGRRGAAGDPRRAGVSLQL